MAIRATWEECRQAAADRLAALGLTGPAGAPLPTYRRLWDEPIPDVWLPCQVVSLTDDREEPSHEPLTVGGDAALVRVGYPVRVELFHRDPGRNDMHAAWAAGWRARVAAAFRGRRLPVTGCWLVEVRALPAFDRALPKYQFLVSRLALRCLCDEPVTGVPV